MIQVKIDFRDFLKTGQFGPVQLGMTQDEVRQLLGNPQDWGGQFPWKTNELGQNATSDDSYPIWKYDEMEFHFGDQERRLWLIWCDHLDLLKSDGKVFQLFRWVFETVPLSREKLEQGLTSEGIDYTVKDLKYHGQLMLASGVEISYEYDSAIVSGIGISNQAYIGHPDHPEIKAS